ncbi:MAG: hypothetical protein P1V97_20555 [Planctomycetota bacterium]|nr:hypothetical protein [Planctomycetota bacterium]
MNKCEICGGPCMTSPCRGCKMSGRVGSNELAAKAEMDAGGPRKSLDEMSEAEILDECATWMAKKNGGTKEQTMQTLGALPAMHVKIMLEKLRGS